VIKAVVFDFDGVIANSEPLHFLAFHDVLQEAGIVLTREDYYESYLGYDDVGVFRTVAVAHRLDWDRGRIADFVARKAVRLERLERERSVLFPGAQAAVTRLGSALPLAIASGALRAEILRVLDHAGLTPFFRAIVAAEDTPVSKPAPDPYLRAVQLLGDDLRMPLAPRECAAIEDSHWGLESARQAGLRTIAITHTYQASALQFADRTIDTLDALTVDMLSGI
jgi:HAD superfamily hydrolase (TIGR01509 family)